VRTGEAVGGYDQVHAYLKFNLLLAFVVPSSSSHTGTLVMREVTFTCETINDHM